MDEFEGFESDGFNSPSSAQHVPTADFSQSPTLNSESEDDFTFINSYAAFSSTEKTKYRQASKPITFKEAPGLESRTSQLDFHESAPSQKSPVSRNQQSEIFEHPDLFSVNDRKESGCKLRRLADVPKKNSSTPLHDKPLPPRLSPSILKKSTENVRDRDAKDSRPLGRGKAGKTPFQRSKSVFQIHNTHSKGTFRTKVSCGVEKGSTSISNIPTITIDSDSSDVTPPTQKRRERNVLNGLKRSASSVSEASQDGPPHEKKINKLGKKRPRAEPLTCSPQYRDALESMSAQPREEENNPQPHVTPKVREVSASKPTGQGRKPLLRSKLPPSTSALQSTSTTSLGEVKMTTPCKKFPDSSNRELLNQNKSTVQKSSDLENPHGKGVSDLGAVPFLANVKDASQDESVNLVSERVAPKPVTARSNPSLRSKATIPIRSTGHNVDLKCSNVSERAADGQIPAHPNCTSVPNGFRPQATAHGNTARPQDYLPNGSNLYPNFENVLPLPMQNPPGIPFQPVQMPDQFNPQLFHTFPNMVAEFAAHHGAFSMGYPLRPVNFPFPVMMGSQVPNNPSFQAPQGPVQTNISQNMFTPIPGNMHPAPTPAIVNEGNQMFPAKQKYGTLGNPSGAEQSGQSVLLDTSGSLPASAGTSRLVSASLSSLKVGNREDQLSVMNKNEIKQQVQHSEDRLLNNDKSNPEPNGLSVSEPNKPKSHIPNTVQPGEERVVFNEKISQLLDADSNRNNFTKEEKRNKSNLDATVNADINISEDDDDGADYVSQITQLAQCGKGVTALTWNYEDERKQGAVRWRCILSGKLLPFKAGDKPLIKGVLGRTRKRAKQRVAKAFLEVLDARLNVKVSDLKGAHSDIGDEPMEPGEIPSSKGLMDETSSTSGRDEKQRSEEAPLQDSLSRQANRHNAPSVQTLRAGTAVLVSLWEHGKLVNTPVYKFERADEQWKCILHLESSSLGSIVITETASSKKAAKQLVSHSGLIRLREMKLPGIEAYDSLEKLSGTGKETEKISPEDEEVSALIVQMSDNESLDVGDDDLETTDDVLSIPNEFELYVARTEKDCDDWLNKHVTCDSRIGVFIDSDVSRKGLNEDVWKQSKFDTQSEIEWPLICVTTASTGIVISAKWRDDCSADQKEKGDFWVPDSLAEVFESPSVLKCGHYHDIGLEILKEKYGVDVVKFDDVSCTSLAITGVARVDGMLFETSIEALAEYWMRQRLPKINEPKIWAYFRGKIGLKGECFSHDIATALISAYVCFCLPRAWRADAKRKKTSTHGTAVEFTELIDRLLSRPCDVIRS